MDALIAEPFTLPGMISVLAGLLGGVLLTLAYPPVRWWPMVVIGPALFLWGLRRAPRRSVAVATGAAFGLAFFGTLLWWLNNVAVVAYVPLVIGSALFPTAFGAALWSARRLDPTRWWIVSVGGWALMEWLRERIPFNGFPWGTLGFAAGDLQPVRGSAQWIGTAGWSVLVMGLAALGVLAASRTSRPGRWWAAVPIVVAVLLAAGAAWPPATDGTTLEVVVVQGSSPCPGVRCAGENREVFNRHLTRTQALVPGSVDLVIWPESSAQYDAEPITNPDLGDLIAAEARRLEAYVMVGATRGVGADNFLNLNILYGPDGTVMGEYAKQHPVPYGEYVPLRPIVGWIPELERVPRDMVRGTQPVVFQLPQGTIGSVISFEGAFARWVRESVREGAQFVVVNTNESSYGVSSGSEQFIAMTRMRAAENGVEVVHAALTGISAFIEADGTVTGRTGLMTDAVIAETVRLRTVGPTMFTRFGDWLQALAVIAMLGTVAQTARKERP